MLLSYPPGRIAAILPGGYGKALDTVLARAYRPIAVCGQSVRDRHFNPDEEHMGSTPDGNACPATLTGTALPQDIKIDRAGDGRVRVIVAPG
jgi:hypothetical protein